MSIAIGGLLKEGFERTVARNGLLFAAIFYVITVANGVISADVSRELGSGGATTSPAPAVGLPLAVAGVLWLVLAVVSLVVTVAAMRTFVSEETERIPREYFTRNVVWAALNLIVGGVLFGIAVGIGLVFLIVPGLFLLVSLFFWNYFVVVEDENFVEAFRSSWTTTEGHRLELFGLGVVVVIIGIVVTIVSAIPVFVLPDAAAFLVQQLGATILQVFAIATAARAYVELTGTDREQAQASRPEHAGSSPPPTRREEERGSRQRADGR